MIIDESSIANELEDYWFCRYVTNEYDKPELESIYVELVPGVHYNLYRFECVFHERKPVTLVLTVNEYGTVVKYKCSCHSKKKKTCSHLVTAIQAINDLNMDLSNLPIFIHYKDYIQKIKEAEEERLRQKLIAFSTEKAMNLMESISQDSFDRLFEPSLKPLRLYVDVLYDYSAFPSFQCKVGSDRLYVVKNMEELVNTFLSEQTMTFGKKTTLLLKKEALDEESLRIFDFLYKYAKSEEFRRKSSLSRECIDDFYHLLKDLPETHRNLCIEDYAFKMPLHLEEYESFIHCFWISEDPLYVGKKEIYVDLDEEGLKHCIFSDQACALIRGIDGSMDIQKEKFGEFYQEVIQPVASEFEIEANFDLSTYQQNISNIRLYADLEDGHVLVWGKYLWDGIERDLFHGQSIRPVSFVEQIVLHYADQQKGNVIHFKTKGKHLYEFLDEGLEKIQSIADVFVSEDLKKLKYRKSLSMQVGFRVNDDLLEIQLDSKIDKEELLAVLRSYRRKKVFHRLKNGEMIDLQNEELEKLDSLVKNFDLTKEDFKKDWIERPAYQALKEEESMDIRKDESVEKYIDSLSKIQNTQIIFPEKYDKLLRPYQKEGVQWMKHLYDIGLNGILADDMGLGKTLQVLCLLDCFIPKDQEPSIIVCPSSLMFNWASEIEKFEVDIDAICVYGSQAERKKRIEQAHDLYITTYDYVKRDEQLYQNKSFMYVILDEAQYIKNPKTKNARTVKALKSKHRLALTGTPIENRLTELWSIFDFLLPGYLYSLKVFMEEIERPIEMDQDEKKQTQLKKMVSPFILRRNKKDVLKDLPDKIERELWLDFSEEERKLYLANLMQVNETLQAQLKVDEVDSIQILAMMTKLRQICCEARMVYQDIKVPSTKLEMCVDLIETLKENNKKVLLFSSFTKIFDWLEIELDKKGIKYHILTGSTSKEQRKKEVEEFQSDDSDVFLISLKAGGTGLNLTQASAVIHFDPWWNSSAQSQATDRAYRIGQNQNVLVYQLMMKNSIEEKIYHMQKRKREMSDLFVENSGPRLSKMSAEDLKELFTL